MAYTQSDLDTVRSARIALASGTKVVRATAMGKSTEWTPGDIPELRRLESEIQAELNAAAGIPSFYLTTTSKGL